MSNQPETLTIGGQVLYPQSLAAEKLGCTVRTLENWRNRRIGPAWTKLGHRVYYRESALEQWIVEQERQPVAGQAA